MKLPDELVLSNSKSNTFRRCEKQYEFKYLFKLRPRELALPLYRGDWLHQLLMVHYDNHPWRERHEALMVTNWDNLLQEEKEELGGNLPEEVERLMKGYLAHHKEEDRRWRTVDTEIKETIELPNGMQIIIIIDKIVEDLFDGGLWIWDYKTVSRFYPLDFMLLDSQLALYFWGAAKRLGYQDLRGAVLDELITKPPTLPKFLEPSQMFERRKNLHCDAYTYFSCIKAAGQDPRKYKDFLRLLKTRHDDWWRRTPMPRDPAMTNRVVKEMMATGQDIQRVTRRGLFTRTARKECQYDCSYLEPCMAQLQGADIDDIIRIKYDIAVKPDEEDVSKIWPNKKPPARRRPK